LPDRTVFVAYPAGSPDAADANLAHWHRMGYRSAVLVDEGDRRPAAELVLEGYVNWPDGMNRLSQAAVEAGADVVVCANDDITPDPNLSAQAIAAQFFERFPSGVGIMQPTGDWYGNISIAAISPWIGAALIRRFNSQSGPYWRAYRHLWPDMEIHDIAVAHGIYAEFSHVTQYHHHHSRGCRDTLPPAKRESIVAADKADGELYYAREAAGFPGYPAGAFCP
jgi:hypothetical protein